MIWAVECSWWHRELAFQHDWVQLVRAESIDEARVEALAACEQMQRARSTIHRIEMARCQKRRLSKHAWYNSYHAHKWTDAAIGEAPVQRHYCCGKPDASSY